MDCNPMKDMDTIIDIPSCIVTSKDVESPSLNSDYTIVGNTVSFAISGMPMVVDEAIKGGDSAIISSSTKNADEVSPELSSVKNNSKREKPMPMSAKKPPRHPRGVSLDAADQKLIKEFTELAMIKRARIERLKKLKAVKASSSSSSSSSTGNLVAMLLTIIFFIVIVFQGCHSSGVFTRNRSAIPITGSHEKNGLADGNIVNQYNLSTVGVPLTTFESPNRLETARGSDSKD